MREAIAVEDLSLQTLFTHYDTALHWRQLSSEAGKMKVNETCLLP